MNMSTDESFLVTRLSIGIWSLLDRVARGLELHLTPANPDNSHVHNAWLAATQDLAMVQYGRSRQHQTYYNLIRELEELDYENLRARYLPGYWTVQSRRFSRRSALGPWLGVIIREVRREATLFLCWQNSFRDGHPYQMPQPSRRWNALFQMLSIVAAARPCAKLSTASWPFQRIMRVLQEARDLQLERSAPGTFLTSSRLDSLARIPRAIILSRDTKVAQRTPRRFDAKEAQTIQQKVNELSARLLRRVKYENGELVACSFQDGEEWPLFRRVGRLTKVRRSDDLWTWEAVPRVIEG